MSAPLLFISWRDLQLAASGWLPVIAVVAAIALVAIWLVL